MKKSADTITFSTKKNIATALKRLFASSDAWQATLHGLPSSEHWYMQIRK